MEESKQPTEPRDEMSVLLEQLEYSKRSFRMMQVTAVCSALTLLIVAVIGTWIVTQFHEIYASLTTIIANLEHITNDLNSINFPELAEKIDTLVTDSGAAMKRINSIDIDSLNASIKALKETVEPLARLFGGGRGPV